MSADVSDFLRNILMHCLDIRTVWSVDSAASVPELPSKLHELVIFANAATLHMLRNSEHLHRADVHVLVVFDGQQFENAWGLERSGSLARLGWRQHAPDIAYYDEAKWQGAEADTVVRSRRKAVRVWSSGIRDWAR